MKAETLFVSIFLSLLTCLPVALAAPVPPADDYVPPRGYKVLPEPPPPGHSGVHLDKANNEVVAHYGEKDMQKHMEHLDYNKRKYPTNDRAFEPVPAGSKANREKALAGTTSLKGFARDEKPPNSAKHDGKVTMRLLPKDESDREMKLLSTTTRKARGIVGGKMRYESNPGPNYHGRGDRSISRQTLPIGKTDTNTKPPWNAGPGKRAESTGPYRKGHAPEPKTTVKEAMRGRPTTPKPIGEAGPSKPKDDKGKSPSSSRSSSTSSSNSHGDGDKAKGKSPSRSPSPHGEPDKGDKGKGKGKARETPGEPAKEKAKEKSPSRSPSPHGEPPKDKSASRNPSPAKSDVKGKEPAKPKPKPAWNAGPGAQGTRKSERVAAKSTTTETKPKPMAQASKPKVGKK